MCEYCKDEVRKVQIDRMTDQGGVTMETCLKWLYPYKEDTVLLVTLKTIRGTFEGFTKVSFCPFCGNSLYPGDSKKELLEMAKDLVKAMLPSKCTVEEAADALRKVMSAMKEMDKDKEENNGKDN